MDDEGAIDEFEGFSYVVIRNKHPDPSISKMSHQVADIADRQQCVDAVKNAVTTFGRLDILCNVAASTERGTLGATQNRFESTINNLQVTTENLAASESRIRDTDMALEMVSFTRHQILTQAGTAMLGQANQLPQGVLRLLG